MDTVFRRKCDYSRMTTDDRLRAEHDRRGDDRLVLWAARARFHADLRRDAPAQPVLRALDHDRGLSRHLALRAGRRRTARGRGSCGARRGARRHLCRAAVLRAHGVRRRHRLDGVELRHLDAARTGGDPHAAAPHLSVSAADHRRAARARAVPAARRPSDHARLRARPGGRRAARALPLALRPRAARHHRQSAGGAARRHQRQGGRARARLPPHPRSAALPAISCSRPISRSRRCSACGRPSRA